MPKKARKAATNPRGRKPHENEIRKMTRLGYGTVAQAAKAIDRAASSLYERIGSNRIPQLNPKRKPVVKTTSGNVWVHLDTVKKFYADPAAVAQGSAS